MKAQTERKSENQNYENFNSNNKLEELILVEGYSEEILILKYKVIID